MSRGFKQFLRVFAVIAPGVALWLPFSPAMTQRRNTEKARLADDPRFSAIHLQPYDAGYIWVGGRIASLGDMDALKEIIESTAPPVTVMYVVDIRQDAQRKGE